MQNRRMIFSRKYNFGYINVPKSACTTIKNIIYILDNGTEYHDPAAIHHDGRAILYIGSPERQEFLYRTNAQDFLFSFVRHPYVRAYSCFKEKIAGGGRWSYPAVRAAINEEYKLNILPGKAISIDEHENNFWNFLRFVKESIKKSNFHPSQIDHWRPQSDILVEYQGIRFIGKVENFEIDFEEVLREFGIEGQRFHDMKWNEGPDNGVRISEIFSDRVRLFLEDIYHQDVEIFDYI